MAESSIARRSEWWPGRRFADLFDWPGLTGWFDWPTFTTLREGDSMLRIEETREGDTLVVRAEMPGIDPDEDVEIHVRDHLLEIRAERREEKTTEEEGTRRSEFRYGSFYRAVPLPPDAKEGDVAAAYKDGILEVRVPCAPAGEPSTQRIPIERK
jgi:HSP20 family protein